MSGLKEEVDSRVKANAGKAPAIMWSRKRCASIALLCFLLLAQYGASQTLSTQNPYKVEAAYLRNFAHYVVWPGSVFPDSNAPWRIVVLGPDPFGEVLERTLQDHTEQGRSFEVYRTTNIKDIPPCQILFVAYKDARKRRDVLNLLDGESVLTVSDAPDFMIDGGIIQFKVGDRVHMSINLDQARAASLEIKTKMLEVSSEVLDQGVIRKVR